MQERALAWWRRLARRHQVACGAAAFALLALAGLALLWSRDARVPLFANPLKPDQVAEVDAQLAAWNVPFTPVSDNLRVDGRNRGELLARLAAAGVPHLHIVGTSEALAAIGTLTPQTVLDAQTRAGLEGDLAKGLRGIGGIADARVIVAPARSGIFADEPSTEASAGVRVIPVPGSTVDAATVAAVRAFVAAAIPGLRPERVTVVDDRGAAGDDQGALDETQRQRALQSALDEAFGAGATIVRVHVERDERARESHELDRTAHPAPVARARFEERLSGDKKSYAKTQISEDRGSDEREERTVVAAGAVRRISIAVIVDAGRGLDLAKIRMLTAAAGGIDVARGDSVSVEAVRFDRPRVAALGARYLAGALAELVPAIALAVVAVCVVRAGARPFATVVRETMRQRRTERTSREATALSPRAIYDALRDEPPYAAAAVIAGLSAPAAAAVLDLYAAAERSAIVARMGRRRSPLLPDTEGFAGGG